MEKKIKITYPINGKYFTGIGCTFWQFSFPVYIFHLIFFHAVSRLIVIDVGWYLSLASNLKLKKF